MDSPPTTSLEEDLQNSAYVTTPTLRQRPQPQKNPQKEVDIVPGIASPIGIVDKKPAGTSSSTEPRAGSLVTSVSSEKTDDTLSFIINGIIMLGLLVLYYHLIDWILERYIFAYFY